MGVGDVGGWLFTTERLAVGPWHKVADHLGIDLGATVAGLLTPRATEALPAAWQGDHSFESASGWIRERDAEASILLVVETVSQQPVGLFVMDEAAAQETEAAGPGAAAGTPRGATDRRIGYLLAEHAWGRGLATELVAGVVEWARAQPGIQTLTGEVDPANAASARVLVKSGFSLVGDPDAKTLLYRLETSPRNEWDDVAAGWDTDGATRAYAAAAFASLRRVLSDTGAKLDGASVVDFGCGTGLLTEDLVAAGASVHAVDTSPAMLEVLDAKIARHRWTTVRTAASLPAAHGTFDLVVCSSVCAFLDDYPATAAELVARLRRGGLFVQWDWERQGEEPHGLTRTEIRDALTAAGLIEVVVSQAFHITVGGQTMSPIMGRGRRPGDSPR